MRNMTVMNIACFHIPIFRPFLQLSGFANLVWCKPCPYGGQLLSKRVVNLKHLRGSDCVGKEVAQDLHIHCGPGAYCGSKWMLIFGGERRIGNKPLVFRFFDERIEEE